MRINLQLVLSTSPVVQNDRHDTNHKIYYGISVSVRVCECSIWILYSESSHCIVPGYIYAWHAFFLFVSLPLCPLNSALPLHCVPRYQPCHCVRTDWYLVGKGKLKASFIKLFMKSEHCVGSFVIYCCFLLAKIVKILQKIISIFFLIPALTALYFRNLKSILLSLQARCSVLLPLYLSRGPVIEQDL